MIFQNIPFRKFCVLSYSSLIFFVFLLLIFGLVMAIVISFILIVFLYGLQALCPNLVHNQRIERYTSIIVGNQYYYTFFVVLTIFLALILRLYNLAGYPPSYDEYLHLFAAKELSELGSTQYTRAFFLTNCVFLLFKEFGYSLFIARIPGVIFGAITIIPLFILSRKISPTVGMITILAWALDPFSIQISRTIREYAIYPFIFLILLLAVLYLITRLVILCNKQGFISSLDISCILLIFLSFMFAIYFDGASTFKSILLFIPPVLVYFVYCIRDISNKKLRNRIYFFTLFSIAAFFLFISVWKPFLLGIPSYHDYWGTFFLGGNYNQFLVIVFILLGVIYYGFHKKSKIYLLVLLIFMFCLYGYSFYWNNYFIPRYGYYIYHFFFIILCSGIGAIFETVLKMKTPDRVRCIYLILLICILFVFFNPLNTIMVINWKEGGYSPNMIEYQEQMNLIQKKYGANINDDSIIISSIIKGLIWTFNIDVKNSEFSKIQSTSTHFFNYDWNLESRFNKMANIIDSHNQGWIFIDSRRNLFSRGLPLNDFRLNESQITYLGVTEGWQVYTWDKKRI